MGKNLTESLLLNVTKDQLEEIESIRDKMSYRNRSEFLRMALMRFCGFYRRKEEQERVSRLHGQPEEGGD